MMNYKDLYSGLSEESLRDELDDIAEVRVKRFDKIAKATSSKELAKLFRMVAIGYEKEAVIEELLKEKGIEL